MMFVWDTYRGLGKRMLDLMIASVALLILTPLLVVISALVWCRLGVPILFRQERPGLRGTPFTLYKFRTMSNLRDSDGVLLPDALRLGSFGRVLRSSSLDELPELWNVVRGDMSLVGPRPLLMQYLSRYNAAQKRRHELRPGLTGLAQVQGRNALTWERKFELDVWYVDHVSLWLDFKILTQTLWKSIAREGISASGQATMHEFRGSGPGADG